MAEGTWVGLDVLARKVVAGVLDAGTGEVQSVRLPAQLSETVEWLRQLPAPVRVGYEAGPTGYGLARACAAAGIGCTVAAPSKIPRAPGDRVKTDRRDAERLARLLRLGELVAVRVPEPHEEAARDLLRAREDARGELMRARHRLSKLLLRHGMVYDASAWTLAHDAWLRRQRFESRPLAIAFDESYAATPQAKSRPDALDRAIGELALEAPFAELVGRLCCLRGVSTLTALGLTVEVGDWTRFRPESLGPFLGLTPSEDSTGEKRRLGAITKTGNTHARRLPVEAAWHQRRPLRAPHSSDAVMDNRLRSAPARTRAPAASISVGRRSSAAVSAARSSPSRSHASSPATAGHSRPCKRPRDTAQRGERRRRRREERPASQLRAAARRRPTLESGNTPHLAHQVMRSRPAHISRDTTRRRKPLRSPRRNEGPRTAGLQAVPT
jgi:transposase